MFGLFGSHRISEITPSLPFGELKKRVKIVVIDDEEDSFPTSLLRDDSYTIEWWPRVDAAHLSRLERGDFDIIVLDIQGVADQSLVRSGEGTGILQRLKTVNPHQIVVAFSGKTYDLDSVQFWKIADETLRKPVSVLRAKEILDRLIQERVSVGHYWHNVEDLLTTDGVKAKKIKKLESRVVQSGQKGTVPSLEDVKKIVGGVESLVTVVGLIHKILVLCRTLVP